MGTATTQDTPPAKKDADIAEVAEVAAKHLRSGGVATFVQLRNKPRRTHRFEVNLPGEDGEDISLWVKYQAIPSKQYDKLVADCPPSAKDRQLGAQYDADTFAPRLISAVSLEPKMTVDEANELYIDPDWSGGEISSLFINALRVCNAGLDVPFSGSG